MENRKREPHPYKAFEGSLLWKRVNRALDTLVRNRDIEETTRREYIAGYLCKVITASETELKKTRSSKGKLK
jgi:hypothetical protein